MSIEGKKVKVVNQETSRMAFFYKNGDIVYIVGIHSTRRKKVLCRRPSGGPPTEQIVPVENLRYMNNRPIRL